MGLMRQYPRVMTDPYALPTYTQLFWSASAVATLAAGYVGSSLIGFLLIVRSHSDGADDSSAHVSDILRITEDSSHCCLESLRPCIAFRALSPSPSRRPLDVRFPNGIADFSAFGSIIFCEAILIGLWFGDHGNVCSIMCTADFRLYASMVGANRIPLTIVLFVGVMNNFYLVWDYIDEKLFDKRNTSDCAQFSELLGWPTASESTLVTADRG